MVLTMVKPAASMAAAEMGEYYRSFKRDAAYPVQLTKKQRNGMPLLCF